MNIRSHYTLFLLAVGYMSHRVRLGLLLVVYNDMWGHYVSMWLVDEFCATGVCWQCSHWKESGQSHSDLLLDLLSRGNNGVIETNLHWHCCPITSVCAFERELKFSLMPPFVSWVLLQTNCNYIIISYVPHV